ncbi:cytidine deaminase [Limnoglobus roseus]|uniref:Cytidine deaminase n=1 Tax=Limnoglobus roseus TaxID=2598579 RepID=A0A5C1AL13_9BACT|nr:cytidine deaminase [Limnoglobus roseus]QEL17874.1 cytidine deaminase [Limnoglobus roseus]
MSADPLFIAAAAARNKAVAPYSGFKVGAAVQAVDGIIYAGCNVESASYGLTICAERVAVCKAISDGSRKFTRIAVFVETDELTPPCGACRQFLWELCGDVEVFLLNHKKQMVCYKLGDLLPLPFDGRFLGKKLGGSSISRPGIS